MDLIPLNTDLIRVPYRGVIVEHDALGVPQMPQQSRLDVLRDRAEMKEGGRCLRVVAILNGTNVLSSNESAVRLLLTTALGMEM